jgi:hypothetical protein
VTRCHELLHGAIDRWLSEAEIRMMIAENPARLLGLD